LRHKEVGMRSQYAKALQSKLFKQQIVKPRKGKGSYTRKAKQER